MFPLLESGVLSGLACGFLFGYVLENAGFGSPCKLTAQFRLTDWSVFKVMFTAIVVCAGGLYGLRSAGLIVEDALFVPSALLVASAIGGALVGAGFAIGGYCPGTSVVGLLSGRMDALVFVVGVVLGTFAFAWLYGPALQGLMDMASIDAGDTFTEAWGVPEGLVLSIMVAALAAVFYIGSRFERRSSGPVNAEQAVAGAPPDA
jgi:hypothetical protein